MVKLEITPEVVASSAFSDRAIDLIVQWYQENVSKSGYLDTLLKWQSKEIATRHLPVCWGSGWACDVPLYLRTLPDSELAAVIDRLFRQDDDEWQECFRVADSARGLR